MYVSLFAISPTPPTSTLSPYTTLFRSRRTACNDDVFVKHRLRASYDLVVRNSDPAYRSAGTNDAHGRLNGLLRPDAFEKDRKSTRLNSSHVSSSYAVSCSTKQNASRAG